MRVFEDILAEINPSTDEIFTEVMGSYELGTASRAGHLTLVPSTSICKRTAVEFYSRFRRLQPGIPMFGGVPQAILAESPAELDWRPALCDEMLLAAFPNLSTADISTFEYLHEIPRLADFRHRLRADAERLDRCSATEAADRLQEVARELRQVAHDASTSLEERATSGWRNLTRTSLAAAVIAGVGFISVGLREAIGGGLLAGSLTAAVEHHKLDPSAQFTGTELALMTLAEGRRPPSVG